MGRLSLQMSILGPALIAVLPLAPPRGAQLLLHAAPDTVRLTLANARALAVRANLELRAARPGILAASGWFRQAGVLLPNPTVDVLGGGEGAEIGLTQEIEIAGQRWARRAAARAGVDRAAMGVTDVARLVIRDVDRAFYRLVAATRRSALADEILALNRRLADFAERQLAAGEISRLDFNLATVEFGRSRARTLTTRRDYEVTVAELRLLLALRPGANIVPVTDEAPAPAPDDSAVGAWVRSGADIPLNVDSLTALALARRPDLAEHDAALRQATAEAQLSAREGFPNLAARASSEPVGGARKLRLGVGITLPLFNRNRGLVDTRRAEATEARLGREAVALRIRAEVARAVSAYGTAAEEAQVLQTTVLAPARENRRLLEVAYREGKVGLPVLLLIRNQVIDAELQFWEAWLAEREARADLLAATGETTAGFDPMVAETSGTPR